LATETLTMILYFPGHNHMVWLISMAPLALVGCSYLHYVTEKQTFLH